MGAVGRVRHPRFQSQRPRQSFFFLASSRPGEGFVRSVASKVFMNGAGRSSVGDSGGGRLDFQVV